VFPFFQTTLKLYSLQQSEVATVSFTFLAKELIVNSKHPSGVRHGWNSSSMYGFNVKYPAKGSCVEDLVPIWLDILGVSGTVGSEV
jgi:hypothetical protein